MYNIILAIHIIVTIMLIIVVLMQRSEGGGLGIGGGGNAKAASRSGIDGIGRFTWILAAAFIALSLCLTILTAQQTGSTDLLNTYNENQSAPAPVNSDDSVSVPALPSEEPTNSSQ